MQKMLPAIALIFAAPVPGQQLYDSSCDDPQTTVEIGNCAYERLQAADAALNREWDNVRGRLKQAEEELRYEGWFDSTLDGQRGWLAYRDGQCAAEGYAARGGSMEGTLVTYCKTRMTRARIKELRDISDSGGVGSGFPVAGRLTVETLEGVHSNGTLYRFPKIGGDSPAAVRVNTFLQTQLLEHIPGDDQENPFAKAWPERGSSNGLVSLDYTLSFGHPGILTVNVFREFYGAYLSSEQDVFHFDARTGQLITPRQLLKPEALARVDADIRSQRLQKIDAFLAGSEVNGAQLRSDPVEADEQRALYQACRAAIAAEHPVTDDVFILGGYSYQLLREECGPRAQWALLDLDLGAARSFEQAPESLSEYGYCLLIDRRANCPRSDGGVAPGVYAGSGTPVTVVVEAVGWDGTPSGWYFHNEKRERISLRGSTDESGNPILIDDKSSSGGLLIRPKPAGGLEVYAAENSAGRDPTEQNPTEQESIARNPAKQVSVQQDMPKQDSVKEGWKANTRIGTMQIGQGSETATFSNVRSSCGMFKLTLAFGVAAAPTRQCLEPSDTRRVSLIIENGQTTSATVEPLDDKGRCVVNALTRTPIDGLTCRLDADVSR